MKKALPTRRRVVPSPPEKAGRNRRKSHNLKEPPPRPTRDSANRIFSFAIPFGKNKMATTFLLPAKSLEHIGNTDATARPPAARC
jgi:hypothetical protein